MNQTTRPSLIRAFNRYRKNNQHSSEETFKVIGVHISPSQFSAMKLKPCLRERYNLGVLIKFRFPVHFSHAACLCTMWYNLPFTTFKSVTLIRPFTILSLMATSLPHNCSIEMIIMIYFLQFWMT